MLIATDQAGRVMKKPSKPAIGRMLANLQRGNAHLVLERVEENMEGSWYVQVLLRDDNTYQLEFRDGIAAEHYQTRTICQEKVLTAMLDWAAAKAAWKDGFMWNSISSQFEACEAQYQDWNDLERWTSRNAVVAQGEAQ
ncbi:hypothetical protein [Streptomyces sp. AcE210]|uniref:hypothetical protein n=1 Tax=Streptomyces sp. AcE210 TaxID=2292703 RepID=UPI0019D192D7|nr:hypothetical protein [Streptomyces sp. AcE210]